MAAGLLVGAGLLTFQGSKFLRNYFADETDTKDPAADHLRKSGVTERLMANPRLLEQYNQTYVEKKILNNSAMRAQSGKLLIARSNSLQRTASSKGERLELTKGTGVVPLAMMGA